MFLITVTYKKPLEVVDEFLAVHRAFLDEGYKKNYFIVSGPQTPRVGAFILSQLKNRAELEKILSADPFILNDVAEYKITEFTPAKFHPDFEKFC